MTAVIVVYVTLAVLATVSWVRSTRSEVTPEDVEAARRRHPSARGAR